MNLQQMESRMMGHGRTVRSFGAISHRFLAKRPHSVEQGSYCLVFGGFIAICWERLTYLS
jgi:hypothetical protein